jgi:hypothetical protein
MSLVAWHSLFDMSRRFATSRPRLRESLLLAAVSLASCVGGTTGREKLNTHPQTAGTAPTSGDTALGGSASGGTATSDGGARLLGGAAGSPEEPPPTGGEPNLGGGGALPEAGGGAGGAPISLWCDGKLCTDSAACNACLQANIENTNCEGAFPPCSMETGNAKDGPAATSPKLELCQATYECGARTKCYRDNLADCYCGTHGGVACLGTGAADGPCQVEIEAGLETTDPSVIAQHLTSPEYAAGAALLLLACAQQYCVDECVTGTATGVGGSSP